MKLLQIILLTIFLVSPCYGRIEPHPHTTTSSMEATTSSTTSLETTTVPTTTVPETTTIPTTTSSELTTVPTTCPTTSCPTSIPTTTSSEKTSSVTTTIIFSTTTTIDPVPTTTTTTINECIEGSVWEYSVHNKEIITYGFVDGNVFEIKDCSVKIPLTKFNSFYSCKTACMLQIEVSPISLNTSYMFSFFTEDEGVAYQFGTISIYIKYLGLDFDWFFTPYFILYNLERTGTIEISYDNKPVYYKDN